jgi:hypothetical protein
VTSFRERRFCTLQQAHAAQRRTHTFFQGAKIASGQASPGDRFVIFFWRDPGGDE